MSTTSRPTTPKPRRRWLQFSLRMLLVLMVVISVPLGWVACKMRQAKEQRDALREISMAQGIEGYDYERDASGTPIPQAKLPGPAWLRDRLGVDFFADVTDMEFIPDYATDAILASVARLPKLQRLNLHESAITDAGLLHLRELIGLRELDLSNTGVTDAGLVHLRGLTRLESLRLDSTRITSAGVVHPTFRRWRRQFPSNFVARKICGNGETK